MRKAKIVATIGPASDDREVLKKLIQAGVDVVRLNFSHGSYIDHAQRIQAIRALSMELSKPVTILQDLQGPKLRVGRLPEEGIDLREGIDVVFTPVSEPPNLTIQPFCLPLDVPGFSSAVKPEDRILLDDGRLELRVKQITGEKVIAETIVGGKLTSHKGVNLPGITLDIPAFTAKDQADLTFGLDHSIDAVAISFVSKPEDIKAVREFIRLSSEEPRNIPIIAKLERPAAIENLEDILEECDGVMVARGDLAVETSTAFVPIIQKRIIELANRKRKLVITATQMLDSMVHNPRPTRAEASDVANAIFDGSDAVMLSGETAVGSYPVKTVLVMNEIICRAESSFAEWGHHPDDVLYSDQDAVSVTMAANALAHDRNVSCVAVFTISGKTALLMSKTRPEVPVMAFTPDKHTFQMMGMYWGVTPYLVPYAESVENMLDFIEDAILSVEGAKPGRQVVVVSGYPVGAYQPPNLLLLHKIRDR